MGVGHHLHLLILHRVTIAPHLGIAYEEQLGGGEVKILHRKMVLQVFVLEVSVIGSFYTFLYNFIFIYKSL